MQSTKTCQRGKLNLGSLIRRPFEVESSHWKGKNGPITLPPDVIETVRMLFDLQDGVKDETVTVYGPRGFELEKTGIEIAARILVNCGGPGAYTLSVSRGKNVGLEVIRLKDGEALMFPFGYPAALDVSVSENTVSMTQKPGWRPRKVKPSVYRHTIVIDFKVNSKALAQMITSESKSLADRHASVSSHPLTAEEIEEKAKSLMV